MNQRENENVTRQIEVPALEFYCEYDNDDYVVLPMNDLLKMLQDMVYRKTADRRLLVSRGKFDYGEIMFYLPFSGVTIRMHNIEKFNFSELRRYHIDRYVKEFQVMLLQKIIDCKIEYDEMTDSFKLSTSDAEDSAHTQRVSIDNHNRNITIETHNSTIVFSIEIPQSFMYDAAHSEEIESLGIAEYHENGNDESFSSYIAFMLTDIDWKFIQDNISRSIKN